MLSGSQIQRPPASSQQQCSTSDICNVCSDFRIVMCVCVCFRVLFNTLLSQRRNLIFMKKPHSSHPQDPLRTCDLLPVSSFLSLWAQRISVLASYLSYVPIHGWLQQQSKQTEACPGLNSDLCPLTPDPFTPVKRLGLWPMRLCVSVLLSVNSLTFCPGVRPQLNRAMGTHG